MEKKFEEIDRRLAAIEEILIKLQPKNSIKDKPYTIPINTIISEVPLTHRATAFFCIFNKIEIDKKVDLINICKCLCSPTPTKSQLISIKEEYLFFTKNSDIKKAILIQLDSPNYCHARIKSLREVKPYLSNSCRIVAEDCIDLVYDHLYYLQYSIKKPLL